MAKNQQYPILLFTALRVAFTIATESSSEENAVPVQRQTILLGDDKETQEIAILSPAISENRPGPES